MKNFMLTAAIAGAALVAPVSGHAQVVDQQWNKGVSATPSWQQIAQSFTPTAGNIVRGSVWMDNQQASIINGTLFLNVFQSNGDLVTSGSQSYSFAAKDLTGRFIDVNVAPAALTVGDQYYLVFFSNETKGSSGTSFFVDSCDTNANPSCDPGYAGGDYGEQNYQTNNTDEYSFADLRFREFAATPAVVATPEPASMVLLATGMVGIVGVARRRKHSR